MFFKRPKEIESIFGLYRGDLVRVVNTDFVYFNYTQMAKKLPKIQQLHWVYKGAPCTEHKFEIMDILDHVEKDPYDKGTVVLVIRDITTEQIYLVNECAVERYIEH